MVSTPPTTPMPKCDKKPRSSCAFGKVLTTPATNFVVGLFINFAVTATGTFRRFRFQGTRAYFSSAIETVLRCWRARLIRAAETGRARESPCRESDRRGGG